MLDSRFSILVKRQRRLKPILPTEVNMRGVVKISVCIHGNRGAFWFCRNNPGDIPLRARTYRPVLSES